jgi:mono/diheme cytochrome c family protein
VRDGVYSNSQAGRGLKVFIDECAKCHGEDLAGSGAMPALTGTAFLAKWNGKTLADLAGLMRKTMPTDSPGSLTARQYADLVAVILRANGYPPGQQEVGSDDAALKEIRIEPPK